MTHARSARRPFRRPSWSCCGTSVVVLTVVLATGATSAAQPAATTDEAAWTIDARDVPAPVGASPELARALASIPAPDIGQSRQSWPTDDDGWRALQRGPVPQSLEALASQFGVSIEPDVIEGVRVYRVMPTRVDPRHADHLFLHVHGGGYVLGGGDAAPSEAAMVASRVGVEALSIDYRMPPDHPFPAAVEDTVRVYRHLLRSRPARSVVIGGTSAGGGLALATVHRLIADGTDIPGAIYAGTPWADLTKSSDTLFTNEGIDRVLVTYDGLLGAAARLYAGGQDLTNPLLSPVYGDFVGFPPTYVVTGTRDMFLSDAARTHRKMRVAGVEAELNVYEGLSHAEYLLLPDTPESQQVFDELGEFLRRHLP